MDFNEVEYEVSHHAVDSYMIRSRKEDLDFETAKKEVLENLNKAEIIIENEYFRYLKYGGFYYPCGKRVEGNKTIFRATTTLTKKMVESGEHFDETLEKYFREAQLAAIAI